jgi:hypothetical protein
VDGGKIFMVCGIPIDVSPRQLGYSPNLHLLAGGDKLGVTKMPHPRGTAPTLATILAFGPSVCIAADAPQGKPNILFIVAEDMG